MSSSVSSTASVSSTDSGTPAPDIAPATQVVPSIGLDGKPTTKASPSTDNGGDTFPTAAAALVGVCAAFVACWIAYKLYRWRHRRWRRAYADEEPPLLESSAYGPTKSPLSGGFATLPSQMSLAFNGTSGHRGGHGGFDSMGRRSMSGAGTLGRSRQASSGGDSWGAFEKGGDLSPSPPYAGTPAPSGTPSSGAEETLLGSANGSRASLGGFPASSSRASIGGGPALGMPRRSLYSSSAVGSTLHHSHTNSSFSISSRHFANASGARDFPSGNRIAGAPHHPASRIEVVPPTPLAPPPGTVIAMDRSTLDFAPSSGIGRAGSADDMAGDGWFAGRMPGANEMERLAPAIGSSSGYPAAAPSPTHPSTSSSSGGSSRGSSSVPGAAPRSQRASNANLRAQASANSSDSSLSLVSADSGQPPSAVGPRQRPHPPLAVRTSNLGLHEPLEPQSPLEKLQMRAEREAKGLSLRNEQLQQAGSAPTWSDQQ